MASIRELKKEISTMANEMALACLLSKAELTESDIQKINAILAEIYNFEDENRKKAHFNSNKKTAKEIRKYYSTLYTGIQEKANAIVDQIKDLN